MRGEVKRCVFELELTTQSGSCLLDLSRKVLRVEERVESGLSTQ